MGQHVIVSANDYNLPNGSPEFQIVSKKMTIKWRWIKPHSKSMQKQKNFHNSYGIFNKMAKNSTTMILKHFAKTNILLKRWMHMWTALLQALTL